MRVCIYVFWLFLITYLRSQSGVPILYSLSQSVRSFDVYVYHIDVAQDSRHLWHRVVSTGRYFDDCLSVGTALYPTRTGCSGKVLFRCHCIIQVPTFKGTGRDNSVGVATRYVLDGAEIESRLGEILRTRPDRPWSPPSLLYNGYLVFPGGKAAGAWRWPPTPI